MGHIIFSHLPGIRTNMHRLLIFSLLGVVSTDDPSANLRDPVLFCDGCYALVSELQKDLVASKGQKLEARIDQGLAGVCSTDKLRGVLKEGFRGGREATVEQLMEQF